MKIGIVGLCHSHPITYAQIFKEKLDVKIPYVYDEDKKTVEDFINRFGGKSLNSPEDFIGKDVDGVIITTRTNKHFSTAKIFIDAGIPTFIDKPMAMNMEQAVELFNLGKKKKAIVMSASALRYAPSFDILIRKSRQGELGKPLTAMVTVFYGLHKIYTDAPDDWQMKENESSGIIYNYGIHCVEPLIAAFGPKVNKVSCVSQAVNLPSPFNDVTIITIEFKGGGVGIGRLLGSTTVGDYQMEIHGTKGSFYAPTMITFGIYKKEAREFGAVSNHGYYYMMKEFLRCIEQKKNLLDWDETLSVINVLEQAKSLSRK